MFKTYKFINVVSTTRLMVSNRSINSSGINISGSSSGSHQFSSSNNNTEKDHQNSDNKELRYAVKNLYKHLMYLGRLSFLGVDYIRDKAKPQFMANSHLTDPKEINICLERTKYVIKEIEALNRLHKYRSLKKSYDHEFQKINDDFLSANIGDSNSNSR
ncbi:hypothetical protein CYY_002482 [Polysphondylium violaceum]|uniref:LYR motif-containing protein 5 n=1 Tax=Polysphondylium violaceum TaxID=133409 RepID=A0A8J4Q7W0_9MYCE|nr:hypothetical protein CYY_002482 [Polysphondylium violaceum]